MKNRVKDATVEGAYRLDNRVANQNAILKTNLCLIIISLVSITFMLYISQIQETISHRKWKQLSS